VGALDAFMTTWSQARATFGEGTPTEGAAFNASKQLRASQVSVESAAPGDRWRGSAADAYAEANRRQGNVLGRMADLDQRLGAEVDRSAAVVAAGRRNLDEVKQWVTDAALSVPAGANREQALMPIARKGIGEVADILKQSNSDLNAIGGRIRAIGDEYRILGDPKKTETGPGDQPKDDQVRIPPPWTSAEDVNKWWKSLSDEQRARLIAQHPRELGNLNGVPVAARSQVNKAVMNGELNRVTQAAASHHVSVEEVTAHPEGFGLTASDVTRYNNACRTKEGLDESAKAKDGLGNHPEVLLMKYDPEAFNGQGAGAIAIGDPDKAANTAVLVKGLSTGVSAGTLANPDGVNLYNETTRADPSKATSVIKWVGYEAPNNPAVLEPYMAQTGGRLLAADTNALAVTHDDMPPPHLTVVGHSYGSTVVSDAAARFGMHADDVVLVGSPGTDLARSAADFHLPPNGHLYVGAASGDPVTHFGEMTVPGVAGLGNDPAMDGFGSTRFKAEVPGYSANPFYDHSHYFDKGSESLFSIADVVAGHGNALQEDGMTAGHRDGFDYDPEAFRRPTTGHFHGEPWE
jgi:pimeloyl-ACP methyl ester carboxylesterase